MARIAPVGHEDRLSIVEHLDELRSRLIVCLIAIGICFAFTYWQNHAILKAVNRPFTKSQHVNDSKNDGKNTGGSAAAQQAKFNRNTSKSLDANLAAAQGLGNVVNSLKQRTSVPSPTILTIEKEQQLLQQATAAAARARRTVPNDTALKPTTLGVTEPFITTFTVAGYSALLISLPLILYQLYAFLLPAFSPKERRLAVPFMAMVPVLFVLGVAFAYFVALPRAVDFLLNFNHNEFNILVGAQQYYKFSVLLMAAVGLLFQIPVLVLAITRLGIMTPKQLAKNRGYVVLAVAIIAAIATPTPDPVTMLVTMAPLLVLFELSLILARIFKPKEGEGLLTGRFDGWGEDEDDDEEDDDPWDPTPDPDGASELEASHSPSA